MKNEIDQSIAICLPDQKIPVYLGSGETFDTFENLCLRPLKPDRVGIISDSNVFSLYGKSLESSLAGQGHDVTTVVLAPGEATKCLKITEEVTGCLGAAGFSRRSVLIALGGGVVGDLAGFVAGTYMRGMDYIHMPTSLLAQVDSSIGGKVGVNHPSAKNLVGLFHQPRSIWIDTSFLNTLPHEEFLNAFGEILKVAFILDEALYRILSHLESIHHIRTQPDLLRDVIRRCIRCKADVVEHDEKEGGYRRVLNFGHSYGHALEAATAYGRFRHGEAVAWGIIMAQRLALELELIGSSWAEESRMLVKRLMHLPGLTPIKSESVCEFIQRDKKNVGGKFFFVFSTAPGQYHFEPNVDAQLVRDVFEN